MQESGEDEVAVVPARAVPAPDDSTSLGNPETSHLKQSAQAQERAPAPHVRGRVKQVGNSKLEPSVASVIAYELRALQRATMCCI